MSERSALAVSSDADVPRIWATSAKSEGVKAARELSRAERVARRIPMVEAIMETLIFWRPISARTSAETARSRSADPYRFGVMGQQWTHMGPLSSRLRHLDPNGYSRGMARTSKPLRPLDSAIAKVLAEAVSASGIARRALSEETGISANRIGIILREEGPASVGEVGVIAQAVGLDAGIVMDHAELQLSRASANHSMPQEDFTLAAMDDYPGEDQRRTVESYMDEA